MVIAAHVNGRRNQFGAGAVQLLTKGPIFSNFCLC